jgi:hypothetical protein
MQTPTDASQQPTAEERMRAIVVVAREIDAARARGNPVLVAELEQVLQIRIGQLA